MSKDDHALKSVQTVGQPKSSLERRKSDGEDAPLKDGLLREKTGQAWTESQVISFLESEV